MQSRFDFLAEQFPKLAEYGQKAEQALGTDNNICLLNLGRIAETISEELCRKNNIQSAGPDVLLENGIIDENICLKIKTLTEIKDDAANDNYASENSASRMLTSALELCEWFISGDGISRFAFLGDMFPENAPCPPLACLAEYGIEAEANLYCNTRYCLLCLGDIEEAVTDLILESSGLKVPDNMEQHKKINNLLKPLGVENRDKIDILHNLRQARNEAVHGRYNSEEAGRKLIDAALDLCEWVFMCIVSPGDFFRGSITEITDEGFSVSSGRICGSVPIEDIPPEKQGTYREGERRVFRVTAKGTDGLTLSVSQALTDPWTNMKRRYEKYEVGQILSATIKRITENDGAFVNIGGSSDLEARIPKSEYGSLMYPASARDAMRAGDILKTRVLKINPEHYPYMLLSVEEAESRAEIESDASCPDKWERLSELPAKSGMPDKEFITFCRKATHEQIINALDAGANPNARSRFGTTPLMEASHLNKDIGAIKELIDAGADINARNGKGNTALIFAVMENKPEVVRLLCESGADTSPTNNKGRDAFSYALTNQRMRNAPGIIQLLAGEDAELEVQAAAAFSSKPTGKTRYSVRDRYFIELCKKGKERAILRAIDSGANVNAMDKHGTTALIYASIFSMPKVIEALIENGADVNAVNNRGVTALMNAVMNSRCENIEILLENGAEVCVANKHGKTLLEYAREKLSNAKCEYCLKKIEEASCLGTSGREGGSDGEEESKVLGDAGTLELEEATALNAETLTQDATLVQNNEAPVNEEVLALNDAAHANDEAIPEYNDTAPVFTEEQPAQDDTSTTLEEIHANISHNEAIPSPEQETIPADTLSPEQQEESAKALKLTFQRDILKIARSGSEDDLAQAINSGISINVTNKSAATPLMFAAKSNSADIIDLLVKSGADLNAQDIKGNTPLIYAAAYNTDDVVDALIDAGADLHIKNFNGYSALDYAMTNYRLTDTSALDRLKQNAE
ncbi:MAG: ankyrin repeat domain-containing protein [Synergistaceae bacterium]|nr:ankyrin repeat domain-containing protein [Synergistaceae bacterium]